MKKLNTITVFCFLVLFSGPALGQYSGGDGFFVPYVIANLSDWQQLVETPQDWQSKFVLAADLDLGSIVYSQAPLAPGSAGAGPPGEAERFRGSIDGQGYAISNLIIEADDEDYVGLIGYMDRAGTVKNLRLENVNVKGANRVGGLAGYAGGWGLLIENCSVSGTIEGENEVGGLIGFHDSTGSVDGCWADVTVRGVNRTGFKTKNGGLMSSDNCDLASFETGSSIGGLIGVNHQGEVTRCGCVGQVSGQHSVGGFAGTNPYGVISHSWAGVDVTGQVEVGGFLGASMGPVTSCYATGNVSGIERIGGFVGANVGQMGNCYAGGAVVASANEVGGFVGFHHPSAELFNSYSTGPVSSALNSGGLIGLNHGGSVWASFWDIDSSGKATSDGGTGKSTNQMKDPATFIDGGWDFGLVWGIGNSQTYPYLMKRLASDLNYDGRVNLLDLAILADQWLMDY